MGIEPMSEAWERAREVSRTYHISLRKRETEVVYTSCDSVPRIELAGDAVDAWPLVSPFVSEQIL